MGLNDTPSGDRLHIGFFGRRNAGKSSVVNAVTGQELAVVSDVKGTTTDPVRKAMELLPLGPVLILDTPGLDDEGELGAMRVARTNRILAQTDIAVLAVDATVGFSEADTELPAEFAKRSIPFVIAFTKADLAEKESAIEIAVDDLEKARKLLTEGGVKIMREVEERSTLEDYYFKLVGGGKE